MLYAEDIRELRDLVRLILAPLGCVFECCDHGGHAWERAQASPDGFDLIITDHDMPVMNGLEFVRRLRTVPFRGKVMVLSSDLDPETAEMYRRLGVNEFLYKPVRSRELIRTVTTLIPESGAGADDPRFRVQGA